MGEGLLDGSQVEPTRGRSRLEAPGRLAKQQTPYPGPWSTPGLYVINRMGKNDSKLPLRLMKTFYLGHEIKVFYVPFCKCRICAFILYLGIPSLLPSPGRKWTLSKQYLLCRISQFTNAFKYIIPPNTWKKCNRNIMRLPFHRRN